MPCREAHTLRVEAGVAAGVRSGGVMEDLLDLERPAHGFAGTPAGPAMALVSSTGNREGHVPPRQSPRSVGRSERALGVPPLGPCLFLSPGQVDGRANGGR